MHSTDSYENKQKTRKYSTEFASFSLQNGVENAILNFGLSDATIRRWILLKTRNHACDHCNKTFAYLRELQKHVRNRHDATNNKKGINGLTSLHCLNYLVLSVYCGSSRCEGLVVEVIFQESRIEYENVLGKTCSSEFLETFALLCQF